jgi:maltose O-acetyltransferase
MKILKQIIYRLRGEVTTEELIKRGLTVGVDFKRLNNVIIDDSHANLITIGNNVTLAPRVHILAHDASTNNSLGKTRIGLVNIGNNVFVGAGSIILPGVTIGNDVVIGAGSVVSKSIPANSLVVGNPARVISSLDEYIQRKEAELLLVSSFDESYTLHNKSFQIDKAKEMKMTLSKNGGIGYVD